MYAIPKYSNKNPHIFDVFDVLDVLDTKEEDEADDTEETFDPFLTGEVLFLFFFIELL